MIRTGLFVTLIMLMIAGFSLSSAETQNPPDLVGNWTGTSVGHDRTEGYDGPSSWDFILSISEQKGRVFNGTISFTHKADKTKNGSVGFSGVIGSDMKSLYMAEYLDGFNVGQIMGPDTLEILYLESGEEASAAIDTFTRELPK
ncbi:MAG TPA: hypothetical protein VN372_05955 [Methanospirillum sp.]|nr:hypothetical protein [Methanospirillum sp.]